MDRARAFDHSGSVVPDPKPRIPGAPDEDHPLAPKRARVVLVHDAGLPIGRTLALHLADRGHVVLATSELPETLADLPRETAMGGLIETWAGPIETRARRAVALFGRLDGLALCHERWAFGAIAAQPRPGAAIDATLASVGDALPYLAMRPGARVALIAALPDHPFAASALIERGALRGLAKALATELDPTRIAVTLVLANIVRAAPAGASHTERLDQALETLADASKRSALDGPLRASLRALARGAPTAILLAQAAANALLTAKPKSVVVVRARRKLMGTRPRRVP